MEIMEDVKMVLIANIETEKNQYKNKQTSYP